MSLGVHLGLAALELPAGILSGSVGLLNDAADTLLDGLASLLVYLGLRFDRERAVNTVLMLFMLGTGVATLYEAARRLVVPAPLEADWFAFVAALLSGLACAGLALYQRFVGMRSGSMVLITQSVDSRNHVIVAGGVTAGLIGSVLRLRLLDIVVGLAVGLLILRSAAELALELVRAPGAEAAEPSRYAPGVAAWHEQFRRSQLRDWMLHLVDQGKANTRCELVAQAQQALDFSRHPTLRALGLHRLPQAEEMIRQALAELIQRGWLVAGHGLGISEAGRRHLREWTRWPRCGHTIRARRGWQRRVSAHG